MEPRKPDSDLESAIHYHLTDKLKVGDIKSVLAQVPGEADDANWNWVMEMKDGRYALITGGCDYTGWD